MLFVSGFSLDPALLPALPRWPGLLSPHNTGTGLIILAGVTHFYAAATRTPQLFANLNANAKRLKICVSLNLIGPGNYQIKFSCASEQLSDFVSVCACLEDCSHCLYCRVQQSEPPVSFHFRLQLGEILFFNILMLWQMLWRVNMSQLWHIDIRIERISPPWYDCYADWSIVYQ